MTEDQLEQETLSWLVKTGYLVSDGKSKGMVYHLPGVSLPTPEQVFFGAPAFPLVPANIRSGSEYSESGSKYTKKSSEYPLEGGSFLLQGNLKRDIHGRLVSPHLDAPIIDDLLSLDGRFKDALMRLSDEPRQQKLSSSKMEGVLLSLCREQYMTLSVMAELVGRNADGLRQQYLSKMVRAGKMRLAFPTKPTHARQAYRAEQISTSDSSTANHQAE